MSAPTVAKADELESLIASHGLNLIAAYEAGDKASAHQHQRAMYQAIAQRAPAKQAERFAEIDQAIAESDGCYFLACGDRDRAMLAGQGGLS